MATLTTPEPRTVNHPEVGITQPFERISAPGCYVMRRTGELLRVPNEALEAGHSPLIDVVSNDPWIVTKISEDPYLPRNKARAIAADMDCCVNF